MFTIKAEIRKEFGKGASRRLRLSNKLPAIIYGRDKDEETVAIELDNDQITNHQNDSRFYEEVLVLSVCGQPVKAKIQSVQRHAYKPKLQHIDFIRI